MDEKVTAVFCAVDEGDTKNISRIVKEALGAGYSAEEIMNSEMSILCLTCCSLLRQ